MLWDALQHYGGMSEKPRTGLGDPPKVEKELAG